MAEMKKIIYKKAEERLMVGLHRETSFTDAGKSDRPKLNQSK